MNFILWIFVILIILLFLYFVVSAVAALTMTKIGDHPQYTDDPGTFGASYQLVRFKSRKDRLTIAAWFIPNPGAERAIILVHGRNANKQNAISGKLPQLGAALYENGFAVLIIDLRGHGESEGKHYTFGERERRDVLGGVDFLLEKGFQPGNIAILGISLGGAAAIGAAAQETAIGALVVESTFADLIDLVEPNWVAESKLPMFFLWGTYLMWRLIYGFDLKKVKPVEDIKRVLPKPILIMHSKSDEMIEVDHAYRLKEAAPSAQLVIFNDCDHAELYRDAPEKYLDTLVTFLKEAW